MSSPKSAGHAGDKAHVVWAMDNPMNNDIASAQGQPTSTFFVKSQRHLAGTTEPQQRDCFTVVVVTSGSRRQFIGDRLLPGDQGSLFFIPPGVPHRSQLLEESTSLTLGFQLEFLYPHFPRSAVHTWASPASLEAAPELMPFAAQAHMEFEAQGELQERLFDHAAQLSACSSAQGLGVAAIARARYLLRQIEGDIR